MSDLAKRIVIRLTDRQEAWIAEQAADEGMDNATFVRVLIDRLSKGRAPLIGMMQPQPVTFEAVPERPWIRPAEAAEIISETSDLLEQRMAEAEARLPQERSEQPAQESTAAIPLRRVGREKYNPRPM